MIKTLLPIAAASLLPLLNLHAAVIGVDWGGKGIVNSDQSLNLPTPTDYSTTRVWTQTGSGALTPVANYNATPLYGIIQASDGGAPANFGSAKIMDRTPVGEIGDRFYLQAIANSPVTPRAQSISGLVYVKKGDFMNGLNSAAPVRFDESSSLSLSVSNLSGGGTGSALVVRLAVLNGDQWYVSQTYRSSTGTLSISDAYNQSWAIYPGEDQIPLADTSYNALDYNVQGSEFDNIQAVGVYFLSQATHSTSRDFSFNKFDASFAPIPEPSSVALLGAAAVGIGFTLRKGR